MQAVRVDTFFLSRVTYSGNGLKSPVVQFSIQTWYVGGVGIVRQITTVPTESGTDVETTTEQLTSWDGVTEGLGAMTPVAAVVPAGNSVFPGQTLPGGVAELFAFAFADHALVFTDTPGSPSSTLASRVDLRGNVLGSTLLSGLRMHSSGVAAGGTSGVVYLEPLAQGAVRDFGLTRIDSNGALVGAVRGVTLSLGGAHVSSYVVDLAAAIDGSTLWLLWSRPYYDPGNGNVPGEELILRPYSLDGVPLGPEIVIDPVFAGSLQVAAADGQVLMTWVRGAPGYDVMFGSASLAGGATVRALASGLPSSSTSVTPLRLGASGALMWPAALGSGATLGASSGVLLDASLSPVRAGATLLDEQIAAVPPFSSASPTALGARIVVTSTQTGTLWPGDMDSQAIDSIHWLDTGSTPLATTPVNTVRIGSGAAKRQLAYADRVLVFGGNSGLTTTVVWLNKGIVQ